MSAMNIFLGIVFLTFFDVSFAEQPHIVFIFADDLGWNDVGFHGSPQIKTPNIDALAYNGLILNKHYTQPICTPSRAALVTGKYPIHTGMQAYPPLLLAEPRALPAGKILPGYLKDLGYSTHLVGKWHLGYSRLNETPTYRGFDSHLGFWGPANSYYDHTLISLPPIGGLPRSGYDMRRNTTVAWDLQGQYATDIYTNEAKRIIKNHPKSKPLFMMVSHLAVHSGNDGKFLEAPQEAINKHNYIVDTDRRSYAGMVSKLDDSLGEIVAALDENNMLENSIIVFATDNGAPTFDIYPTWGSNYPLRGIKATLWEGSVRGVAAVYSPLIKRYGVSENLFHLTDWLPTLVAAAGGDVTKLQIDGVNQWPWLTQNAEPPRNEVLLNIYEQLQYSAVIKGKWKLHKGRMNNGKYDGFYGESGVGKTNKWNIPYYYNEVTSSLAWNAFFNRGILRRLGLYLFPKVGMNNILQQSTVKCPERVGPIGYSPTTTCNPTSSASICLFNLEEDPCEIYDVSNANPTIVQDLLNALDNYAQGLVPQTNVPSSMAGIPELYNYTWSNFLDLAPTTPL